jgi:hypothetical protein
MYRVLEHFHDLEDFKADKKGERTYFEYNEGDTYPRDGYEPAEWRIDELMGGGNPLKRPLIEEVDAVTNELGEPTEEGSKDETGGDEEGEE